jgi:hypothetical protein
LKGGEIAVVEAGIEVRCSSAVRQVVGTRGRTGVVKTNSMNLLSRFIILVLGFLARRRRGRRRTGRTYMTSVGW